MCDMRLHQLALAWPRISRPDVEMIAVFQSSHESITKWISEKRPPVRAVADPDMKLYSLYGVETSLSALFRPSTAVGLASLRLFGPTRGRIEGPLTRVPANFLIDRGGVFRDVHYGKTISDHIPLSRVERWLSPTDASLALR